MSAAAGTPRSAPSRVSVGLPVYNAERFLEEALASLLGQTYREFELVIVDNGSLDRTEEICRAHADRDERIRYFRSEQNRGASWSFNSVFRLSAGEYFKWAAHDDLCAPAFLDRCVPALDSAPAAVLVFPKCRLTDALGTTLRDHEDDLDARESRPHERLRHVVRALGYANPVYGLIRADALRQTRLLGAYPSADYVLLAELALLGEFHEVPERLFLRRIHDEMSRATHPTAAEAAAWFDPAQDRRHSAEAWRLCLEHLVAIARAPLSRAEKVRCYATFADVGGRRYWDHLARELWALLAGRSGPARARPTP